MVVPRQGRRERSYLEGTGATEDAASGRAARSGGSAVSRRALLFYRWKRGNAFQLGYTARSPSSSSIRSSWLYFATRSLREGAPVLIWPQPVATARSAIVVSSVSPERCDITQA